MTIIAICSSWGEITLYNIYNDCEKNDTIHELETFARSCASNTTPQPTLWLSDFNRHHPHWDNPTDTRLFTSLATRNVEILISTVAELGLDLALPLGIPTHLHNVTKKWTRLDQVFILED